MRPPLLLTILGFLLCCCQSQQYQQQDSVAEAPRHHEIVFQNKEETLFEVKSTAATPTTTGTTQKASVTTARPASPTFSTSRAPNRRPITRRTTSTTTTTTTAATTTVAEELKKNGTADRIGDNAEVAPSDDSQHCNCISADQCPLVGNRIVTPESECPHAGHVYCCFTPHKSPPPTCGIRPNISIPEVALKPGQAPFAYYPWTAALLDADTNTYIGGGVLLDNVHILTAAHKVNSTYLSNVGKMKVRLGEWDATGSTEPHHHQDFAVTEVTVYPEFNGKNLRGDLAILTLDKTVALRRSPHIAAACVPRRNSKFTGNRCFVSGWGQNSFGPSGAYQEIMKHTDVPIIDSEECELRLRDTKLSNYFELDRKSFICAGGEPDKDACTGDGGSPLVCENPDHPNQFFVVGLVAWGIGCATPGVPGVYVNVAAYSDWISDVTVNFKHLGH